MLEYKASQAQFWFEVGGQPAETFQVAEFYGHENISQLFSFEIRLISALENDLDLPDFLDQPAKLTIRREDEKKELHGILSDLEETGRSKDFAFYRGVFVPRLWKLSLFYQSRVFQNLSVPDIVKEVFKTAGFSADDYKFDVQGNYKSREYCVQYRETDLNFISRLLEYEGIYYFFDHAKGKDVVMMVDNNAKNPKIEPPDEINSFVGEGFESEQEEVVSELVWRQKVVTGKVKLKDYNYRTPETALVGESVIDSKSPGLYYEYGEHFKTASEGTALAKIRNEEIEAARRIIAGASNCRGFHAGFKFTLAKHYREALNGDYLLIQVSHVGSQVGGLGLAGGSTPAYRNQFSCIPASVQFRPPRLTPEPRLPGIMTSKVETGGGDYAHIDEDGRYRVKMPFDMGDKTNATASRAIRMAQPYSGANYGMHFPNRANTEMVWACIDGNVDRPLGLSTVPNPSNTSPSVAGNKPQCVIRSAGQNELTLDDTIASENIYLHGTKDWTIDIVNDKNQSVGHDETLSVGNNRSKTVGVDQSESIGKNKTIDVGDNHTESIGKNKQVSVGENHDESIGGNMSLSVGKNLTESVGKSKSVDVADNLSEQIGKDTNIKIGKNFTIEVGENTEIKIGKKTKMQSGDDLTITGQKKAVIDIKDQLTIKCGSASIIMKKNGDIQIKGKNINIEGSGKLKLKGSQIAEN